MSTNEPPTRSAFRDYLIAENKTGSNKAASYLRDMDLLQGLLSEKPMGFQDCQDLWRVESVERLQELLLRVKDSLTRTPQRLPILQTLSGESYQPPVFNLKAKPFTHANAGHINEYPNSTPGEEPLRYSP